MRRRPLRIAELQSGFPNRPAGDEQAGGGDGFGVAEGGESGTSDLLVGLTGARNDRAGEVGRQAFLEPLERKQTEIAAGHVDDARGVFDLRQRRVIVRLRVMAGGEDDVGGRVAAGERAADGGCGSEGCSDAGNDLEGNLRRSVSAAISSAARPKMSGSPLLRRTTRRLARACSIISALISSCVMLFVPQRLPTLMTSAEGEARSRIALRDEVVVEDDVGGLDEAQRLDGEQVGVAGACADERTTALPALRSRHRW